VEKVGAADWQRHSARRGKIGAHLGFPAKGSLLVSPFDFRQQFTGAALINEIAGDIMRFGRIDVRQGHIFDQAAPDFRRRR